ncbi:hypothetical protein DXT99_13115 [Pontibacter diazotrophicus]|uniref:Outer membrane protein beta-barrel domain-containing protein n=1 Tax=Pontibacter diazotrophicus TaxID=1400979 RepID=A0A3D8LB28_9BACT|nr:hypothetical protein [Pontibacter diazotrophicus]RDV14608.1 hypothetical protein DXT99_13115 [Pontibacter diazotrophicus]
MKYLIIFTILLLILFSASGQDKKDLTISVSGGLLTGPYYNEAAPYLFGGVDFDYHLSGRHVLAANFIGGYHTYYEDEPPNIPVRVTYSDGNNATAEYTTFSVMYKYKILHNNAISIVTGVGAGIVTQSLEYPSSNGNTTYRTTTSWSTLVFPVSLDLNFMISEHWQAGLKGGFIIHPDFPILALYAGPKLSYTIK